MTDITTLESLTAFVTTLGGILTAHSDRATVVLLDGDLGSGKTTLVQTLGRQLGITEPITSPTYTIFQTYELTERNFSTLIHMDAYRIEDEAELVPLRLKELLATPGVLICIEWGSRIASAIPTVDARLTLTADSNSARTVTLLVN